MAAKGGAAEVKRLLKSYRYPGMDTCAADGLCATQCPVEIDTGKMIKALREEAHGPLATAVAGWVGSHFGGITRTASGLLDTVDALHKITNTRCMELITRAGPQSNVRNGAAMEPGDAGGSTGHPGRPGQGVPSLAGGLFPELRQSCHGWTATGGNPSATSASTDPLSAAKRRVYGDPPGFSFESLLRTSL